MLLDISSSGEWKEAEVLLVNPTSTNMESLAALVQDLVERSRKAIEQGAFVGVRKSDLARFRRLLDNAFHLRLGLARTVAAGQAGYAANGQSVCGPDLSGSKTTVAVI